MPTRGRFSCTSWIGEVTATPIEAIARRTASCRIGSEAMSKPSAGRFDASGTM